MLKVIDSKGNDVTNQMDIKWDDANHKVVISAKDPKGFFNKYKGSKLTVDFPVTIIGDDSQDIKNQAIQNTFGNENKTNVVTNHQPKIDPKKDVVLSAGSKDSLNGKEIPLNQNVDYKISAERPDDYGGNTIEWSIVDNVPKEDQVTGQWQVYATFDITLADKSVIKQGTDISKYFTFSMKDRKVVIKANKDFLDIINKDVNKKNPVKWDAYFQVKRIGYGKDITNIAQESYNNQIVNTNKVVTNTTEPKKDEPAKNSTPQKTVTMPQTGRQDSKASHFLTKLVNWLFTK